MIVVVLINNTCVAEIMQRMFNRVAAQNLQYLCDIANKFNIIILNYICFKLGKKDALLYSNTT